MKLFRRFLVVLIPPLVTMAVGVWLLFQGATLLGNILMIGGYLLLPLTPVWAYPIIERMEDRLDRR